jgi:UDP-N-acetylglucosamine transferase subunit ALG13
MIFVTVGTEKYPFDRLIKEIDRLKCIGKLRESVLIQLGSCKYKPLRCKYKSFFDFEDLNEKLKEAKIVIAHGGCGSVLLSLFHNRIPIIIPRLKKYGEDVDNHQLYFTEKLEERGKVIAVYEIRELGTKIENYDKLVTKLRRNRQEEGSIGEKGNMLAKKLDEICLKLLKQR